MRRAKGDAGRPTIAPNPGDAALRHWLTRLGTWTAHPVSFAIVAVYGAIWIAFGTFDWHGGATLATWPMTLFIQRAEHRDTQAIHAKLDEIIRSKEGANAALTTSDSKEPEAIEKHRDRANRMSS